MEKILALSSEETQTRDEKPEPQGRYTIFHALFEALKEKEKKKQP